MQLSSLLAVAAVAASALFATTARADNEPLPWDGRGDDITVATLTDKFLTHILTQRQNGTADPADWVTIDQTGRSPGFNDDTGVINIAVDADAIFGGQTNFRRSELVQNLESGSSGTTFFRFSLMKEEAYVNEYSWQVVFPESHSFEIRIDASVDPPMLIFYTGGSLDVKWETEFETSTWYNFGVAVTSTEFNLYYSTGDDTLALTKTVTNSGGAATSYEFHFGQLTLSSDGSAVAMVSGVQDILAFNGVSVEDGIPSDLGASSGSATTTTSGSASASTATTTAPATTTTAPTATTAAPTATTAAPATTTAAPATTTAAPTATTSAPAATTAAPSTASSTDDEADAEADSEASEEDDDTTTTETEAPEATTEAPVATTSAPSSSSCKTRVRRN